MLDLSWHIQRQIKKVIRREFSRIKKLTKVKEDFRPLNQEPRTKNIIQYHFMAAFWYDKFRWTHYINFSFERIIVWNLPASKYLFRFKKCNQIIYLVILLFLEWENLLLPNKPDPRNDELIIYHIYIYIYNIANKLFLKSFDNSKLQDHPDIDKFLLTTVFYQFDWWRLNWFARKKEEDVFNWSVMNKKKRTKENEIE